MREREDEVSSKFGEATSSTDQLTFGGWEVCRITSDVLLRRILVEPDWKVERRKEAEVRFPSSSF